MIQRPEMMGHTLCFIGVTELEIDFKYLKKGKDGFLTDYQRSINLDDWRANG